MKTLTLARDLKRRRARERHGLFVAEGVRTVEELLASPLDVRGLLVSPQLLAAPRGRELRERVEARGLSVAEVSEQDFASAADTDTPQGVLAIGGVPGRRGYLRFDLPRGIVDSTSVVRATLLLTQYPNRLAAHGPDTLSLYPQPVVASEVVADLRKAATLLGSPSLFRLDSLRTTPVDSGEVGVEVVGLLNVWRTTQPERASRALVLRLPSEGVGPDELYFYSVEAAAGLRPRLRIVYVPRLGVGLP